MLCVRVANTKDNNSRSRFEIEEVKSSADHNYNDYISLANRSTYVSSYSIGQYIPMLPTNLKEHERMASLTSTFLYRFRRIESQCTMT